MLDNFRFELTPLNTSRSEVLREAQDLTGVVLFLDCPSEILARRGRLRCNRISRGTRVLRTRVDGTKECIFLFLYCSFSLTIFVCICLYPYSFFKVLPNSCCPPAGGFGASIHTRPLHPIYAARVADSGGQGRSDGMKSIRAQVCKSTCLRLRLCKTQGA